MTMPIESLQSDAIAYKLLGKIHQSSTPNAALLYRTAAKIGACARQAVAFEAAADKTDWSTAPLLEYYAMLHWLKVLLHLSDLDYPPSSAVLQHGMSSRRIKRDNYRWPLESVYLYKQGVLQSFWALAWSKGSSLAKQAVPDGDAAMTQKGTLSAGTALLPVQPARPVPPIPPALPSKLVIGTLLWQIPAMREPLALFYPQFAELSSSDAAKDTVPTSATTYSTGRSTSANPHPTDEPISSRFPDWFLNFVLLFSLSGLVRYNPVEWSDIVVWSNESDSYLVREFFRQPRFRFRLEEFVDF